VTSITGISQSFARFSSGDQVEIGSYQVPDWPPGGPKPGELLFATIRTRGTSNQVTAPMGLVGSPAEK